MYESRRRMHLHQGSFLEQSGDTPGKGKTKKKISSPTPPLPPSQSNSKNRRLENLRLDQKCNVEKSFHLLHDCRMVQTNGYTNIHVIVPRLSTTLSSHVQSLLAIIPCPHGNTKRQGHGSQPGQSTYMYHTMSPWPVLYLVRKSSIHHRP